MILRRSFSCMLVCLMLITTGTTKTLPPLTTVASIACLSASCYLFGKHYSSYTYHNALQSYTPALDIMDRYAHNYPLLSQHLRQEIIQNHICRGHVSNNHETYRYYPFIRYKKDLESTLTSLILSRMFNVFGEKNVELEALIQQLHTLELYLDVNPHYLMEQRDYDYCLYRA